MAGYDLNGNPLPDDGPPPGGGMAAPPPGAPGQQFDLMGNPLPMAAPPGPAYGQPPPAGYAPPPGPPPSYGPPPGAAPPPYPAQQYPGPGGPAGAPMPPGSHSEQLAILAAEDAAKKKKIVIGVSAAVGVWIIASVLWALFPPSVPAPDGYTPYTSFYKTFSVDMPDGWKTSTADGMTGSGAVDPGGATDETDHGGVLFSNGTARIDITQGTVADAKATALLTGAGTGEDTLTGDATSKVFAQNHVRAKGNVANYEPTSDTKFLFYLPSFGSGESETFTASGPRFGIGGAIHGYYVVMCGHDKTVAVVCECREKDWDKLQPVFKHVVNSLTELGPSRR